MPQITKKEEFLKVLKPQIFLLIDDIKSMSPPIKHPMWFMVKQFFMELSDEDVMNHIIQNVLPYKAKIFKEDENFFISNEKIFGKLPRTEVDFFRKIVKDLDNEDKEGLWNYFKVFVALAEGYKKIV